MVGLEVKKVVAVGKVAAKHVISLLYSKDFMNMIAKYLFTHGSNSLPKYW
jgi:proteasome assembly chaperone (PAC2) family protein